MNLNLCVWVSVAVWFVAGLVLPARGQTAYERDCERLLSLQQGDSDRLHALLDLNWAYTMRENPELATQVGYPGLDDRWSDESLQAIERWKEELRSPLKVLHSIHRNQLSAADRLDYDLFLRSVDEAIEGARFKSEYLAISQLSGVHHTAAETIDLAPRASERDYENILLRLQRLPVLVDQTLVLLSNGAAAGITVPRITLRDVPEQIKGLMDTDPGQNVLLKPFEEFPREIPAKDRTRLRQAAVEAVQQRVIPAFAKLFDFLETNYIPAARESVGLSALPDGKAWYAFNVRVTTTTMLTPAQIHERGLSEVKRIRAEMDAVIAQVGFKGSFAEFSSFLRTDPRFYHTNAQELLRDYRDIAKRLDPELIRFFGKLPRLPYGVRAIPTFSEKSQTTAYYEPGSVRAGRPGYFCANTYALNTRPSWEMEALTSHESVPGHHLQISLAQEMEGVPEFRKYGGYTAFVEGWGLYAEGLAEEMGMYKDPYSKFGELTYEMWRAIRLVVDTGIHSMGWTRQQAIDYFLTNSSKSEHDVMVEVDRYIVWPGQALAYKIGQMKFRELRAYANRELGDKFDIRAFHDEVLANGALPMDVLEAQVKAWVESRKR